MDTYDIDGITYNDGVPHSRIEKELQEILENIEEDNTGD